jgi:CheY-like chemotaxis protein
MRAGYTVISASDGDEALLIAAAGRPDLIVLDMMLPKLSGPEVLRFLKKDVRTADIPVIVCSGLSQKNEAKLRREGAIAFLEKSFLLDSPDQLLTIIKTALQSAAPRKAGPVEGRSSSPRSVR